MGICPVKEGGRASGGGGGEYKWAGWEGSASMTIIIVVWWTGGLGVLPSNSELASGGIRELDAEEEEIGSASREPSSGMVL